MGDAQSVTDALCKARTAHTEKRMEEINRVAEKRLDAHASDIDSIQKAIIQNSQILERVVKLTEKLEEQNAEHSRQMAEISQQLCEYARQLQELKATEHSKAASHDGKKKWYETKAGEKAITALIIIAFLIVGTAVGINVISVIQGFGV